MQQGVDWDLKTCERKYVVFKVKILLHFEKSADKPRYNFYVYVYIYAHKSDSQIDAIAKYQKINQLQKKMPVSHHSS